MSRKKRVNRSSKLDHILGLDLEEVKENIGSWITGFLSQSSSAFNNLPPCPFAKKAWTDSKVEIILCPNPKNFGKEKLLLDNDKEVLVYILDRVTISPAILTMIADEFNKNNPEYVALEDHPEEEELVAGVRVNHGCYAMILMQKRNKLGKFRESLVKQGYYDNWDENYLKDVIEK